MCKIIVKRYGNIGGDNPNDTYLRNGEFVVKKGFVSLAEIDCGGFYSSDIIIEIQDFNRREIRIKLFGEQYTVKANLQLTVEKKDGEKGRGGESFTAFDEITIKYEV